VSDIAYRQGSIYRDITNNEIFWLALTILMTGVLLMGLLHRQRHGIAKNRLGELSGDSFIWQRPGIVTELAIIAYDEI